jgi:uncharacterized membrane protein YdbT with pleckstrin-like domain
VSFPENYLDDDEELIFNLREHWLTFAAPAGILVAGLIFLIIAIGIGWTWLTTFAWIVFAVTALNAARGYAQWTSTAFVLTSERVMYRTGLFRKSGVEIPLERINNMNFEQSLLERMVGAGDLLIESAGASGQSRFENVNHPDRVANAISRAADLRNERMNRPIVQQVAAPPPPPQSAPAPASAGPGLVDQIRQLDELRKQGLLTDAEFEQKKADLLGRM